MIVILWIIFCIIVIMWACTYEKQEACTDEKQKDSRLKEIKFREIKRYYSDDDLKEIEAEINALTIKKNKFTNENSKYAINKDPFILKIIPDTIKNNDLCEFAVSKCGLTLKYVPDELKSDELCYKAILNQPQSIKYANSSILNDNDFINLLLDNLTVHINDLPESLITYDRCYRYIKNKETCLLQDIPDKYKDKKICELAFSIDMLNIQFFPPEYQSIDLWIRAIDKDKRLLKSLPDIYTVDREIYQSAIEENPAYFLYIPNDKKDFEMCVTALAKCKQLVDEECKWTNKLLFQDVYKQIPQKWRDKVCLYIGINISLDYYLDKEQRWFSC